MTPRLSLGASWDYEEPSSDCTIENFGRSDLLPTAWRVFHVSSSDRKALSVRGDRRQRLWPSDIKHQPQDALECLENSQPRQGPGSAASRMQIFTHGVDRNTTSSFAALGQQPRVGSLIEAYHRQRDLPYLSHRQDRKRPESGARAGTQGRAEQERRVNLTGNGRAEIPLPS